MNQSTLPGFKANVALVAQLIPHAGMTDPVTYTMYTCTYKERHVILKWLSRLKSKLPFK